MRLFNYKKMTDWSHYKEPWYTLIRYAGYNVFEKKFFNVKMAIWRIINVSFPSHYILSAVVFCCDENWDIQKSSEAFMIIFIANIIIVQFLTLILGQKIIVKVDKSIQNMWKSSQNNKDEMNILKSRAKEGHMTIVVLFITVFIASFAFDIKAAILRHDKVLPMVFMGYGIRSVEGPYYALNLLYHNFALFYPIVGLVPFHSFYVNFVMQLVGKLQIVRLNLEKIKENVDHQAEVRELLSSCYYKHLDIIRFGQLLSSLFKFFLLSQLSSSTIVMCLAMYTSRGSNIITQMNSVFVLCSSTFHLFIFCWFGERLTYESNMLAETIYECPWYALKNREKRVLLMILARSQRPIKINVLGFYDIGLSTFTAVAKTAYSWCAVLNTVDN